MNLRTARAKLAALAVLFFLGTFAGQIQHLLDSVRGKVDRGAQITGEIRSTVSTLGDVVGDVQGDVYGTAETLRAQIAELQAKLAGGTATPAQVTQLRGLVEQLRAGAKGPPGPPGAAGATGPPGPAAAPTAGVTTSSTGPGGTTSTTRPTPATTSSTTTTRPTGTTTTTRCLAGLRGLIRVGC